MNTYWYFENTNLFKILCPHKYPAYKKDHTFNNYKKSDYIYFEEDAANKIYLIDNGKVKIGYYTEDGKEVIKAILTKGEMFGEKAILGVEKRNEFAQSIDNSTLICPVSKDTMYSLMRDNASISFKVYKFIGIRIKRLERRLQLLLFKDTKTRLLEFFDELCEDYGYECDKTGDNIIKHPYTQKDIATLIGTSRPTLNTLMNELKQESIIDFNRKELRILKKIA
ncbi:cAMP-binding domain of CRP or a regulatory subunit of cAMP-dependent protein kinases [Tenacibaculum sp. MAR_2009_124]|uniref:Crp/Fnr family transcriptional regulator n=1 Tax=Tenacibaculum sp. MAR_2009_124 TaxID=1250059 RepID=UPI00089B2D76|nr:Crp/Fnr family transcriptional regulator [Tenacibaculum sp. MAR_2009_124]SEB48240.1 cAMP-binding domain of CRP or a regulatory subunit of cAMP-dependent protein kinases [Tenacibaculum sp. MAR_2009_124]